MNTFCNDVQDCPQLEKVGKEGAGGTRLQMGEERRDRDQTSEFLYRRQGWGTKTP